MLAVIDVYVCLCRESLQGQTEKYFETGGRGPSTQVLDPPLIYVQICVWLFLGPSVGNITEFLTCIIFYRFKK